MDEKRTEQSELWAVDEVVGAAIEQTMSKSNRYDDQDLYVKVERLGNNVLAMSVHESQLWRVLSSLHAHGIQPYRCLGGDTSAGEYELLYVTSQNPELDAIRYQRILDNAA